MDESLDAWFVREILTHEAPLVRYLTRAWLAKDKIHELRQETYRRVYEAAAGERPRSAKSFLFATAQQLLVSALGERVVARKVGRDVDDLNVTVDEKSPDGPTAADEEVPALVQVLPSLSPRCRQVVWMRRVEQKSQKEIAACLGIGEAIVQKHIATAVRRLADALFGCQFSEKPKAAVGSVREDHDAQQCAN